MKKLIALFLSLCLLIGLCACTQEQPTAETTISTQPIETTVDTQPATDAPTAESSITPLLYEVTDASGNTIWVMGSIHLGDDYFYPMPDYVMNAYNSADVLAVEFDAIAFAMDFAATIKLADSMLYADGSKFSDHVSPDLYERAVQALTDSDCYMEDLENYTVSAWSQLFDELLIYTTELSPDLGVDMYFLSQAYEDNKAVASIESAEFHMNLLNSFSDPLQELLLEDSLNNFTNPETYREAMNTLVTCWASGDEAAMVAILDEEDDGFETDEEKALYAEYHKAMSTDRNINMTDYAENALATGQQTFIVVGTAHIVGEGGLVDLLTQRGYTVTCLGGTPMANAA